LRTASIGGFTGSTGRESWNADLHCVNQSCREKIPRLAEFFQREAVRDLQQLEAAAASGGREDDQRTRDQLCQRIDGRSMPRKSRACFPKARR
jgi:hypothetical protein